MTSLFFSPNKWPIIFYPNEYPSNFKLITSIKEIEIFIMVKEELKSNNWFFQPNKLTTVYNWWSYCKSVWFMQEIVIFYLSRCVFSCHWCNFRCFCNESQQPFGGTYVSMRVMMGFLWICWHNSCECQNYEKKTHWKSQSRKMIET